MPRKKKPTADDLLTLYLRLELAEQWTGWRALASAPGPVRDVYQATQKRIAEAFGECASASVFCERLELWTADQLAKLGPPRRNRDRDARIVAMRDDDELSFGKIANLDFCRDRYSRFID